jgi:hypothetical protein
MGFFSEKEYPNFDGTNVHYWSDWVAYLYPGFWLVQMQTLKTEIQIEPISQVSNYASALSTIYSAKPVMPDLDSKAFKEIINIIFTQTP